MADILTIPSTGPDNSVNLGTLIESNPAKMTLTLLSDDDPGKAPADTASIHLSESVTTTPGVFLTAGAPRILIIGNPSDFYVSVHGATDFVQVFVE